MVSPNGLAVVYVGRPTKWGNPFEIEKGFTREQTMKTYSNKVNLWNMGMKIAIKQQLKGNNLACWCKPSEPYHADILLKIANS